MRYLSCLPILSVIFLSCGSSSSNNKEIKETIAAFTDFYTDKDIKVIKEIFAEEPQAIVHSMGNEQWKGVETIKKKIEKTMDDVENSNIDIHEEIIKTEGNVAWFSIRGDWSYDVKNQRQEAKGVRMTGVLLNQGGKWKIVQWHSSLPVRTQ